MYLSRGMLKLIACHLSNASSVAITLMDPCCTFPL